MLSDVWFCGKSICGMELGSCLRKKWRSCGVKRRWGVSLNRWVKPELGSNFHKDVRNTPYDSTCTHIQLRLKNTLKHTNTHSRSHRQHHRVRATLHPEMSGCGTAHVVPGLNLVCQWLRDHVHKKTHTWQHNDNSTCRQHNDKTHDET